eukprot:TRINITY_DN6750_c0_g1_i1.p1 TRINITY_DN6750_c0_g1~~TRINITY_DN6750_c0_g1_i1.p1  ORF type:complete len:110 (+),score=31.68 TRINITY_DN6750_c0_g1_i1:33-332(+)
MKAITMLCRNILGIFKPYIDRTFTFLWTESTHPLQQHHHHHHHHHHQIKVYNPRIIKITIQDRENLHKLQQHLKRLPQLHPQSQQEIDFEDAKIKRAQP